MKLFILVLMIFAQIVSFGQVGCNISNQNVGSVTHTICFYTKTNVLLGCLSCHEIGGGYKCGNAFNAYSNYYYAVVSGGIGRCYRPSALPINLESFSAEKKNNDVFLKWVTLSEQNNDYFSLEKSHDGKQWVEIATVLGAGFSDEKISYSFIEKNSSLELDAYYRLTQVDFNGEYQIFDDYVQFVGKSVNPKIISILNILGLEVEIDHSGLVFIRYEDGKIEKKYND